ncbi:MAG: D-tyrosyl-tRNA(Tyr) deacylase [Proteobacteria bacterium]|nr:D-tyrosyl-tRNA(Tyr) deacylase [Pseudomonadota bacterium]
MLTVIQVVNSARVEIDDQIVGIINEGLLILCGFESKDNEETLKRMIERCLNYRIFSDEEGKMNRSLKEIDGGLLLVPQFTLLADTTKGLRPSFSHGAKPNEGLALFTKLVELAKTKYDKVESGIFGANMQVHLCNNGPATFLLHF